MTVYVDDAKNPYGRMFMCHMAADSIEELHAMAEKLGLKRDYFQGHRAHPHYDICIAKRRLAVKYGAREVTQRQMVLIMRGEYFEHGQDVVVILLGAAYLAQVMHVSPVKHVVTTRPDDILYNIPLRMPYTMGELRSLDKDVKVYRRGDK